MSNLLQQLNSKLHNNKSSMKGMKIGLIIIFYNNENGINKYLFSKQIKKTQNINFCLVNNCSNDKTYQILKEIKEECGSTV
jgi:hypothetical protein